MTRWHSQGKLAEGDAAHHDGGHGVAGQAFLRFACPWPLLDVGLAALPTTISSSSSPKKDSSFLSIPLLWNLDSVIYMPARNGFVFNVCCYLISLRSPSLFWTCLHLWYWVSLLLFYLGRWISSLLVLLLPSVHVEYTNDINVFFPGHALFLF
jgi:Zn-dependent protease with chaperone function